MGALGAMAPLAAAQQPVQGQPSVIDGPSADIDRPAGLGLSVARDGSGGLVYLKQVNGAPHVFVSPLVGGVFRTPIQVDAGLGGPSSQPVIAAGNGGLLLVGFVNSGELYVVDRGSQSAPFGTPTGLAAGASNPSISITNFPKAYLAFSVTDGGGSDVRTAYYNNGRWSLEGPPLNAAPADNAGIGPGRPDVAAAGDGVAVVVWGENHHIYSRRVWGTNPSVVHEQADSPPGGCTEVSADNPVVGAGGDSSYAPVAFREQVTCGGHQQSRVLTNRLHASIYDGITNADGLSGAPADGAQDPQIAVTEYGRGWVSSERTVSGVVVGQSLGSNGQPNGTGQVSSLPMTAPPDPVPATAGLSSTFIAWQQQPGAGGPSEIRVRYAPDGSTLGPEMVASSPAQGPVDAGDGIGAAGDVYGEAAVAWLQGPPGATTVVAEQMYQSPGAFSSSQRTRYAKTSQPTFAWTVPHGWGPMAYTLSVDGAAVAQTYASSATPSAPLPDGLHSWRVLATNPVGQQSRTKPASLFIDTVRPHVKLKLPKLAEAASKLGVNLTSSDPPPAGQPRSHASGVAKTVVRWGDGKSSQLGPRTHLIAHVYRRPGRYRITVTVTDKAGNVTRLTTMLRVVKKLPKHLPKPRTVSSGGPSNTSSPTGGASSARAHKKATKG